ncbi:MAG: hypothetical protein B7Y89_17665 [Novosphingobium sp. 32-60-15]|uniref:hypothetical protein n=1 Tax=Novosphingobium sp. 32-60-15 TaxID=1970410 RepID=UPI000BC3BFB9|nr:hypothetical protein [Novosphingobium sp. 32-60-15]OYX59767.1 MAG: hypothetical protein B7Y89_17665 [Novosphingobium sp. 32-60-15]
MSRHDLQPKADQPHVVRATVGWDRPLQTFFAQVFFRTEDEPDEGEALIWFGTEPGELMSGEAAIAIVRPHVEVPGGLADQLDAEMRETIGVKDGHHQTAAKRSLFGSTH